MTDIPQIVLPHGGYRKLIAYRKADVSYERSVAFCRRFLPALGKAGAGGDYRGGEVRINHGSSRMRGANACAWSMADASRQLNQGRALAQTIRVIRGSDRFDRFGVGEKRYDADEGDAFFAHPVLFVGIACDNLDEIIVFCSDKSVQVESSWDDHKGNVVLLFWASARYFKAHVVYHKDGRPNKSGFLGFKVLGFLTEVRSNESEVVFKEAA